MSFATLALAGLGGGLQAMGQIQAGNAAKQQAEERQIELNNEAQLQQTAATQSQADRLRSLGQTVGAIRALGAQRGLSLNSPSSAAVESNVEDQATRDARNIQTNADQQSASLKLAGRAAIASGTAAQQAGYIGAASSLFKTASSVYQGASS